MPDVRNCRRCGKVYNYIGGTPICSACRQLDEEDFKRIKEYLYDNPGATLSEVSTVLEISVEKIRGFLKDGRLEILGNEGNMVLECEKCGKAITTGRYCQECTKDLTNDLRSTASQISNTLKSETHKDTIALRYLNKNEKGRI